MEKLWRPKIIQILTLREKLWSWKRLKNHSNPYLTRTFRYIRTRQNSHLTRAFLALQNRACWALQNHPNPYLTRTILNLQQFFRVPIDEIHTLPRLFLTFKLHPKTDKILTLHREIRDCPHHTPHLSGIAGEKKLAWRAESGTAQREKLERFKFREPRFLQFRI